MNYEAIAMWSQVASSVLFLVVLVWMFRKFIIPVVMTAQKNKNEEIARAEQRRDEAKAKLEELRATIGNADEDAAAIKERAIAQAQREREAAVAEAKASGERALRNAQGELDRARAAARETLRNELVDKALVRAREEASKRITPAVNVQLVERFVSSLERGGRN